METLKKLRATIRRSCVVGLPVAAVEQATMWATTLDAYIKAQESAKPNYDQLRDEFILWHVGEYPGEPVEFDHAWSAFHHARLDFAPPPREPTTLQAIVSALESNWDNAERAKALRALGIEVKP